MIISGIFIAAMLVFGALDAGLLGAKTGSPSGSKGGSKGGKNFKGIIGLLGVLGALLGVFLALFEGGFSGADSLLESLKAPLITLILSLVILVCVNLYALKHRADIPHFTIHAQMPDNLAVLESINATNADIKGVLLTIKDSNTANLARLNENLERNNEILSSLLSSLSTSLSTNLPALQSTILATFSKEMENLKNAFIAELDKNAKAATNAANLATKALSDDFKNSINLYFSENFKRFNRGVDNLLEWQEGYKKSLDENANLAAKSGQLLEKITQSLERLQALSASIIERDERIAALYGDVGRIMQEYRAQNVRLTKELSTLDSLSSGAVRAIGAMNAMFADIDKNVKTTTKTLHEAMKAAVENVLLSSVREFEASNKAAVLCLMQRDEALNGAFAASVEKLQDLVNLMLQNSANIAAYQQNITSEVATHIKAVAQSANEMMSNINKDGMSHLRSAHKTYLDEVSATQFKALNAMSSQITKNHEMLESSLSALLASYLKSLESATHSSLESTKTLGAANLAESKQLNAQIADFVKDNAKHLSQSNLELLNILELLQKQIESAAAQSQEAQSATKAAIEGIEDSLSRASESFKNDYEWFLRRIREIIGQRM